MVIEIISCWLKLTTMVTMMMMMVTMMMTPWTLNLAMSALSPSTKMMLTMSLPMCLFLST